MSFHNSQIFHRSQKQFFPICYLWFTVKRWIMKPKYFLNYSKKNTRKGSLNNTVRYVIEVIKWNKNPKGLLKISEKGFFYSSTFHEFMSDFGNFLKKNLSWIQYFYRLKYSFWIFFKQFLANANVKSKLYQLEDMCNKKNSNDLLTRNSMVQSLEVLVFHLKQKQKFIHCIFAERINQHQSIMNTMIDYHL